MPATSAGMTWTVNSLPLHMLGEKFLRALPRQIRRLLAEARTIVIRKGVRRIGVDIDLRLRLFLLDCLDHVHRDAFVFIAEVHLNRASRFFVGKFSDDAAVVAHGCRKPRHAARGEEGGTSTHAVADDADRADPLHALNRRRDVMHHVIPIEIAEIAARVRDFVGRVAALEVAHEAVEHGGRNGRVADRSEAVAHRADVLVDAEYLLDNHHAAFGGSGGIGAVCAERMVIGGGQGELLTQRYLPYFFRSKIGRLLAWWL